MNVFSINESYNFNDKIEEIKNNNYTFNNDIQKIINDNTKSKIILNKNIDQAIEMPKVGDIYTFYYKDKDKKLHPFKYYYIVIKITDQNDYYYMYGYNDDNNSKRVEIISISSNYFNNNCTNKDFSFNKIHCKVHSKININDIKINFLKIFFSNNNFNNDQLINNELIDNFSNLYCINHINNVSNYFIQKIYEINRINSYHIDGYQENFLYPVHKYIINVDNECRIEYPNNYFNDKNIIDDIKNALIKLLFNNSHQITSQGANNKINKFNAKLNIDNQYKDKEKEFNNITKNTN